MNSPTCDQCDCVAGCQANPQFCPNLEKPAQWLASVSEELGVTGLSEVEARQAGYSPLSAVAGDLTVAYRLGMEYGQRIALPKQSVAMPAFKVVAHASPDGEYLNYKYIALCTEPLIRQSEVTAAWPKGTTT